MKGEPHPALPNSSLQEPFKTLRHFPGSSCFTLTLEHPLALPRARPGRGIPSSLPTVSLHQPVGDVPARRLAGPDDLHYLQGRHRAQEQEEETLFLLQELQNALKDHPLSVLPQGAAASASSSHLATLYPEVPGHRVPSLDPGELVLPQFAVLGVKEKLWTCHGLLAAHEAEK